MRTIIRNIGIIILLFSTINSYAQDKNIQEQVKQAFINAQKKQEAKPLIELTDSLEILYNKHHQNIFMYWYAYAEYYTAIFYYTKKDKENAEKYIDRATERLKDLKNKTSEAYALLSLSQGFAIQFKNMIKQISLSKAIQNNGKLAIEKDSTNLRAYYALACNDFYTPEQYGGGKYAEQYLLKAIALPEQKIKNEMLPSWGKVESYGLLIQWYIRKKDWTKAEKYYKEAITAYPDNYSLKQLASKLKNN